MGESIDNNEMNNCLCEYWGLWFRHRRSYDGETTPLVFYSAQYLYNSFIIFYKRNVTKYQE